MRHPPTYRTPDPRRAFVLLAVLVVIVLLSLAAYQFSDLMGSERRVADSYQRLTQARALADSGVHYAAIMLSNPDAFTNNLGSMPFNNPQAFQGIQVNPSDPARMQGRFSLLAPLDINDPNSGSQSYYFGVTDEAGKINLNALMQIDPSGQVLNNLLMSMNLSTMTQDIADSICDWLDADDEPRNNGAEESYYSTLSPPYHCKNGPLDSIEELLLVKGVTARLLFGNDRNRNGSLDPGEDDGSGALDRGLAAYFTIYSREQNIDSTGNPRVYVNAKDLQQLQQDLSNALNNDQLVSYILAYRLYGASSTKGSSGGGKSGTGEDEPSGGKSGGAGGSTSASSSKGGASGGGAGGGSSGDVNMATGKLSSGSLDLKSGKPNSISSLFELVNSSVDIPSKVPGGKATRYSSPLNDPGTLQQYLPILLDKVTTVRGPEIPARINVNTAPLAVLQGLQGISKLQDADVQNIIANRPNPLNATPPDPSFQTLAWLITQANIPASTLKSLDKYITASTQVYRVQSLGYFDKGGPTARVEAVIDTNQGYPRILYRRDISELGKGYDLNAINAGSAPGSKTPGG